MKAIVYYNYGSPDVLACEETEKPVPKDNEVLIRVCAASVNPLDWHFMRGTPYPIRIGAGLPRPKNKILGVDVAGEVEAIGAKITRFKPGEQVFGTCRGSFAEYVCAPETTLTIKSENLTFEQVASGPVAALTALQGLRNLGQIGPGKTVLINGASGGVGTFAVQIAKSFGANVTGVCSMRNVDLVRSIGADQVFDYMHEDFTKSGLRYDLFFDAIGNHSLSACRRMLNPKGIYVIVGGQSGGWMIGLLARTIKMLLLRTCVRQKMAMLMTQIRSEDLKFIHDLMQAEKVKPVIDKRFPLDEVPQAVRYLEEGRARGKVLINVGS